MFCEVINRYEYSSDRKDYSYNRVKFTNIDNSTEYSTGESGDHKILSISAYYSGKR